jgi:hypothetical protein
MVENRNAPGKVETSIAQLRIGSKVPAGTACSTPSLPVRSTELSECQR